MHGGLFEVGEIDGDLCQIAGLEVDAHRFHVAQAAAGEANGFGDFVGYGNVGSVEVDVVGHEEFARPDDGDARGGMEFWFANVGLAIVIAFEFVAKTFELAAADIFKVHAIGPGGGGFVEIDGNAVTLPDFVAYAASERDTVFEREALDGNEGDDVGGADARVRAGVMRHVDEFEGAAGAEERGFGYGFRIAGKSDDAAIVVGVHFLVENVDAGNGAHDLNERVDVGRVAAFGEIRDTLNQSFHSLFLKRFDLKPGVAIAAVNHA